MNALVQIAQALADETRLRLLMQLLRGTATVSDLVTRLEVPQPRVSTHLALLRRAGLVVVEIVGRQRVYGVTAPQVQTLLDALQALAPDTPRRSPQAGREVRRNTAMRQARTCYDHLAGVAGVQLLAELRERGWIVSDEITPQARAYFHLSPLGTQALIDRGVDVIGAEKAKRRFAYGCLDWTERRAHLGGALGAAILSALQEAGIIQRQQGRTVALQQSLSTWFDD